MRDTVQPATERVLHTKGPHFASQHEKRGLERVLGGMLVLEDTPANAEDHGSVPLNQCLEGHLSKPLRPGGELRQQLGIRHPAERAEVPQSIDLSEHARLSARHIRSLP